MLSVQAALRPSLDSITSIPATPTDQVPATVQPAPIPAKHALCPAACSPAASSPAYSLSLASSGRGAAAAGSPEAPGTSESDRLFMAAVDELERRWPPQAPRPALLGRCSELSALMEQELQRTAAEAAAAEKARQERAAVAAAAQQRAAAAAQERAAVQAAALRLSQQVPHFANLPKETQMGMLDALLQR